MSTLSAPVTENSTCDDIPSCLSSESSQLIINNAELEEMLTGLKKPSNKQKCKITNSKKGEDTNKLNRLTIYNSSGESPSLELHSKVVDREEFTEQESSIQIKDKGDLKEIKNLSELSLHKCLPIEKKASSDTSLFKSADIIKDFINYTIIRPLSYINIFDRFTTPTLDDSLSNLDVYCIDADQFAPCPFYSTSVDPPNATDLEDDDINSTNVDNRNYGAQVAAESLLEVEREYVSKYHHKSAFISKSDTDTSSISNAASTNSRRSLKKTIKAQIPRCSTSDSYNVSFASNNTYPYQGDNFDYGEGMDGVEKPAVDPISKRSSTSASKSSVLSDVMVLGVVQEKLSHLDRDIRECRQKTKATVSDFVKLEKDSDDIADKISKVKDEVNSTIAELDKVTYLDKLIDHLEAVNSNMVLEPFFVSNSLETPV